MDLQLASKFNAGNDWLAASSACPSGAAYQEKETSHLLRTNSVSLVFERTRRSVDRRRCRAGWR